MATPGTTVPVGWAVCEPILLTCTSVLGLQSLEAGYLKTAALRSLSRNSLRSKGWERLQLEPDARLALQSVEPEHLEDGGCGCAP